MNKRNRSFMLILAGILMAGLIGCSSTKRVFEPYLAEEESIFSILIVSEKEDFHVRTLELNKLIENMPIQVEKAGVITNEPILKYLKTDKVPVYILLDHQDVIFFSHDLNEFRENINTAIQTNVKTD